MGVSSVRCSDFLKSGISGSFLKDIDDAGLCEGQPVGDLKMVGGGGVKQVYVRRDEMKL